MSLHTPFAAFALIALAPSVPALAQTPSQELRAADAAVRDFFGKRSHADADTLVVGSPSADTLVADTGAAYVFVRSGTTWVQQQKLVASDADTFDGFGEAVAVELDTLVVGAPGDDDSAASSGSAYVFVRSGTSWTQQAKLTAIDPDTADRFGGALSISGDTIAVSAPYDRNLAGPFAGSVHVFVRQGTLWSEQAKIRGLEVMAGDFYGLSVSIEGDLLVAGAPGTASDTDGLAYVHHRVGTQWAQLARLVPSDVTGVSAIGVTVALSGNRIAVGAGAPSGGNGAIFVFRQEGASWIEEARLSATDATPSSSFALALAFEDDVCVVGGRTDGEQAFRGGAAWVFQRDDLGWRQRRKLTLATPQAEAGLGWSVALAGESVFVGAYADSVVAESTGAVYAFDTPPLYDSFCDAGDNSLAACPCSPGAPDTGCDIAQSTGGVALAVLARETSPLNRAVLQGTGFPPTGSPTALVVRASTLDAGGATVFGDGLRCVGTPLVRMSAAPANGGQSQHVIGHSSMAGTGDFHYQLWFRNTPLAFCDPTAAFNLSNGRTIPW